MKDLTWKPFSWWILAPIGWDMWELSYRSVNIPELAAAGTWPVAPYGFLGRQLGLAADYLHTVEVITADEGGRVHDTPDI